MATQTKHSVHLGGRDRGLRYTLDDREAVEAMYPRPDGTPCNLWELVQGHFMKPGSFAVQAAILWAGIHSHDSRITLDHVRKWLRELVDGGGKPTPVFKTAFDAILESGVLGFTVKPEDYEADEGEGQKGDPKAEPPQPAS